ncbi:MAG: hypothetical protein H6712_15770 [Myxococcales bacterium]|nr:hypothetical protein [Myxococcales bacterium]MCB9715326.1 hypothetical protein [Myxococcales bacterium]
MVGIRRAIALLLLGFYVTQFAMTAGLGPDELFACYLGLALVYGTAFVGLAAEWFWARWFAIGVANFGSLILLVLLKVGMEPIIAFVGFTHLAIWLLLLGEGMASRYEYSEATAERWNLQEESLILMRRSVKSAGTFLPFLVLWALGPEPEGMQLAALGLGVGGLVAMLRGRTWGVLALGGAGVLALADGLGVFGAPAMSYLMLTPRGSLMLYGPVAGLLAGGLMLAPMFFAGPIARFLRAR